MLTQVSPWGVRVGPNGNVFVARTGDGFGSGAGGSQDDPEHDNENQGARRQGRQVGGRTHDLHLINAQIYEFDGRNGNFLRAYIGGNDHGLQFATGFDFVPGWSIDCNFNQQPDSCDISLSISEDLDADGTPDECEVDCNANGIFDRLDLIPHGAALDCNANLSPDACDISAGVSADCTANGIPDECEPDCNNNLVADSCDISAATSDDCNANGVPDECDVSDDLETDTGWTAGAAGDTATAGIWTRVMPIGTAAQPGSDHTPGTGTFCFVTGQGTEGGSLGQNDVDGGITTLLSPVLDLSAAADPEIGYWRWYSNTAGSAPEEEVLTVEISDDGGQSWTLLETVGPSGPEVSGGWFLARFRVSDHVSPTSNVVLRFVAADLRGPSNVEAAVDDLVIFPDCCPSPAEVAGVTLTQSGLTHLDWGAQGGGVSYDIVGDDVAGLHSSGTDAAQCLIDGVAGAGWDDPRPDPDPGQTYYYLVRSQSACADGTYGLSTSGDERLLLADWP